MISRNVLVMITPQSPPRLEGIARFARAHNWHLMSQDRLLHRLDGWNGDGVLVTLRDDPDQLAFVRRLRRRGISVVDLTVVRPEFRLPRVVGDHREIGRMAARHFGDRHFGHLAWFSSGWTNVHRLRYEGLREAWPGEPPVKWVFSEAASGGGTDDWRALVKWLGRNLIDAPKPLAVVAYDDSDATRVLDVAHQMGLSVPEEVAILGIGNDTFLCENQTVPISSVVHDAEGTGYEGAALLDKLMNGGKAPSTSILIPPKGVVARPSTDLVAVRDPLLNRAVAFIANHIGSSFGIVQIADALGVAPIRLHRRFAAELHCRVGDEIRRQRIARVRLLLENTALSIGEIAAETGFRHPAHLTNAFKKTTGFTPKVWRRWLSAARAASKGEDEVHLTPSEIVFKKR